jgi:hypothetical protein
VVWAAWKTEGLGLRKDIVKGTDLNKGELLLVRLATKTARNYAEGGTCRTHAVAASLRRREVRRRRNDCAAKLTDSSFSLPLRRLASANVCLRRANAAAITAIVRRKPCACATGGIDRLPV